MDDLKLWNTGTALLKSLYEDLSADAVPVLTQLLTRYRETKEVITAIVAEVDASSVCRECGGLCCLNGKYRINVFDTLACLATQTPISVDFTQKPICPYGTDTGCTLVPGLRPADCIQFVCDAIDGRLSLQTRSLLVEHENVLRECIAKISGLTGQQMGTPLLLWAEECCNSDSNNK